MKKVLFLLFLAVFLTACDKNDDKSYTFNGTVTVVQYPDGDTLSLKTLREDYESKIRYVAVVKKPSGEELSNISVSWGTINVPAEFVSYPSGNRMVINTDAYTPDEAISIKASYGGKISEAKDITFTE